MAITYGYDVAPIDDPFLTPLEVVSSIASPHDARESGLAQHLSSKWVVGLLLHFPSWVPGADLKPLADRCRELSPKIRDAPFDFVKESLAKGIDNDSMVGQLLKDERLGAQDQAAYEQNIKDCAVSNFIAGTDTSQTQSTLNTLIMALGGTGLPSFDDRESLNYIDALLVEALRWGSLVPMAIPHMVAKDDVFEQRLIPKGSVIIPNLWGMARDEDRFPDPSAFKPERHLDADGKLRSEDISGLYFGYGRRICPGRYIANASTWLAAAYMLSMFQFGKAIGLAGYEIDIYPKFSGGVALRPAPFRCRITPRFEKAAELLN
ncbi:cytochrome P450 [Chiua virens]|nr:cytochrome P450 [Chiua virens]